MHATRGYRIELVAIYPDADLARRAIEALSRAGIDGGDIRLHGVPTAVVPDRADDRRVDRGVARALGGRYLRGLLVGAAAGIVFGVVVFGLASDASGWWLVAGAAGGATFGAGVGALVSLLGAPTMATGWGETFSSRAPRGVALSVLTTRSARLRRARRVLARTGAVAVEELAHGGSSPAEPA